MRLSHGPPRVETARHAGSPRVQEIAAMTNSRHDRRAFIHATGAALAGLAGAPSLSSSVKAAEAQAAMAGGRDPELIVVNAKVYTMDTRAPRAEAFAVANERFTAVGTTADIKGLAGKN